MKKGTKKYEVAAEAYFVARLNGSHAHGVASGLSMAVETLMRDASSQFCFGNDDMAKRIRGLASTIKDRAGMEEARANNLRRIADSLDPDIMDEKTDG